MLVKVISVVGLFIIGSCQPRAKMNSDRSQATKQNQNQPSGETTESDAKEELVESKQKLEESSPLNANALTSPASSATDNYGHTYLPFIPLRYTENNQQIRSAVYVTNHIGMDTDVKFTLYDAGGNECLSSRETLKAHAIKSFIIDRETLADSCRDEQNLSAIITNMSDRDNGVNSNAFYHRLSAAVHQNAGTADNPVWTTYTGFANGNNDSIVPIAHKNHQGYNSTLVIQGDRRYDTKVSLEYFHHSYGQNSNPGIGDPVAIEMYDIAAKGHALIDFASIQQSQTWYGSIRVRAEFSEETLSLVPQVKIYSRTHGNNRSYDANASNNNNSFKHDAPFQPDSTLSLPLIQADNAGYVSFLSISNTSQDDAPLRIAVNLKGSTGTGSLASNELSPFSNVHFPVDLQAVLNPSSSDRVFGGNFLIENQDLESGAIYGIAAQMSQLNRNNADSSAYEAISYSARSLVLPMIHLGDNTSHVTAVNLMAARTGSNRNTRFRVACYTNKNRDLSNASSEAGESANLLKNTDGNIIQSGDILTIPNGGIITLFAETSGSNSVGYCMFIASDEFYPLKGVYNILDSRDNSDYDRLASGTLFVPGN